jgi:hypothetical protein
MKGMNPDRGPKMMEGEHTWNKGYVSDEEHFSPESKSNDDDYRGNMYMDLQNEAVRRDTSKIDRSKFSKIA